MKERFIGSEQILTIPTLFFGLLHPTVQRPCPQHTHTSHWVYHDGFPHTHIRFRRPNRLFAQFAHFCTPCLLSESLGPELLPTNDRESEWVNGFNCRSSIGVTHWNSGFFWCMKGERKQRELIFFLRLVWGKKISRNRPNYLKKAHLLIFLPINRKHVGRRLMGSPHSIDLKVLLSGRFI